MLNAATRLVASHQVQASAEQAIREAINSAPHQHLGKPFPIVVHYNGVTLPFMAYIARIANPAEQSRGLKTKVTLTTVKWGLLLKGHPKTWISTQYELDGKDNLKPSKSLPKEIDEHEAEQFFHTCGVPVPAHH
jgi:hypothetical protein